MSAVNPRPDSALHSVPEAGDDGEELALPTQPWHEPPAFVEPWRTFEPEYEPEFDGDAASVGFSQGYVESFDFHDTIPAPPWLDEPSDACEMPVFPAR